MKEKKISNIWCFIFVSYILFGILVLGLCGTASMVFHASPLTMRILSDVCAWSPTFTVLILHKRLKPELTIRQWIGSMFKEKMKVSLLVILPVIMTGSIMLCVWILTFIKGQPFASFWELGSFSLAASILLSVLSGPTGEEAGWRGYLRYELEEKYGFTKGALLLGITWTFWHTILWFVDSDFSAPTDVILYVLSNLIVLTAITVIMNCALRISNNLFIAVLIHFCFNMPYCFLAVDITYYVVMCVVFPLVAFGFWVYMKKTTKPYHI